MSTTSICQRGSTRQQSGSMKGYRHPKIKIAPKEGKCLLKLLKMNKNKVKFKFRLVKGIVQSP